MKDLGGLAETKMVGNLNEISKGKEINYNHSSFGWILKATTKLQPLLQRECLYNLHL